MWNNLGDGVSLAHSRVADGQNHPMMPVLTNSKKIKTITHRSSPGFEDLWNSFSQSYLWLSQHLLIPSLLT